MSCLNLLRMQHSLGNSDPPVPSNAQEKDNSFKCRPTKEHETSQAGCTASNPVSAGDKSEHCTNHAECDKEDINQPTTIWEDRDEPECDSELCQDETTGSPATSISDSAVRDGVYTSLFEFNRIPPTHRRSLRAYRTQGKVQGVPLLAGRTRRSLHKIQKNLSKKDNTIVELRPETGSSSAPSRNRFLDTDGDIIFPSVKELCEMNESDKEEWQCARSLFWG